MAEEQEISKQLPEELISETELNISSIPQTETQSTNMEVHHHPNVEKKGLKEYFLEFLMIFLAVTMGFFAENLREDISNREILKNNMETIVANLKSDKTNLKNIIEFNT